MRRPAVSAWLLPELVSGRGTAARSVVVEGEYELSIAPPPRFARSPSPRQARGGMEWGGRTTNS